jgi:hypothetical protein
MTFYKSFDWDEEEGGSSVGVEGFTEELLACVTRHQHSAMMLAMFDVV